LAVERRFRTRYNTDIFARLVDTTPPHSKLVPPPVRAVSPPFHESWYSDLRASSTRPSRPCAPAVLLTRFSCPPVDCHR
jgi:hypothetical protein